MTFYPFKLYDGWIAIQLYQRKFHSSRVCEQVKLLKLTATSDDDVFSCRLKQNTLRYSFSFMFVKVYNILQALLKRRPTPVGHFQRFRILLSGI